MADDLSDIRDALAQRCMFGDPDDPCAPCRRPRRDHLPRATARLGYLTPRQIAWRRAMRCHAIVGFCIGASAVFELHAGRLGTFLALMPLIVFHSAASSIYRRLRAAP